MGQLNKYKLKNTKGITRIVIGNQEFALDSLSDLQAEFILNNGGGHYIEAAAPEENTKKKSTPTQ